MSGAVTFRLSEADFIAAQQDWRRAQFYKRKMPIIYVGIAAFAVGFAHGPIDKLWPGLLLLVVAIAGLGSVVDRHMLRWRARRMYRETARIDEPVTVSWSDEGMIRRAANGTIRNSWSDFRRWYDGRSAILLYFNSGLFLPLPHAQFGAAELSDLRDTIARNVRRSFSIGGSLRSTG